MKENAIIKKIVQSAVGASDSLDDLLQLFIKMSLSTVVQIYG